MMKKLTALETKVFNALKQNADDVAGGDFGIMDEVNYRELKLNAQQFGALVTTLQTKGYIEVHEPLETNGGPKRGGERITQFTINR